MCVCMCVYVCVGFARNWEMISPRLAPIDITSVFFRQERVRGREMQTLRRLVDVHISIGRVENGKTFLLPFALALGQIG